jgi:hypothetical protein
MAVPSFVGVLGRSPEDLPSGRPQVRDRHLKFHEDRDNLLVDGQTYHFQGWTIMSASGGTTFTNDATHHGMSIGSAYDVKPF